MKTKFKLLLFLFALSFSLVFLLLNSNPVLADGMMIVLDPYADRWDYALETNQQAFINYKNGLEKLILSVGMEESNINAVWIFPVPAEPEKTVIDILPKLPRLSGEDVAKKAKSKLPEIKKLLQLSQLYPYLFLKEPEEKISYRGIGEFGMLGAPAAAGVIETDVVVHEHLEKEGLTTEVVTAKTAQGLFEYLKNKNLKIEKGAIPALDHYIGKEFTFVISWITPLSQPFSRDEIEQKLHYFLVEHPHDPSVVSVKFNYEITANFETLRQHLILSREEGFRYLEQNPEEKERLIDFLVENEYLLHPSKRDQKGVFVTFPTKKIYYPLIPTSVYGSKKVPAVIRVLGFVSPRIFSDIKGYTKISYFTSQNFIVEPEFEDFYDGVSGSYTKIEINAPSKLLTEDLWISKRTPLKAIYALFIANYPEPIAFILLMISSIITGIIIGLIVFREARSKKGLLKYAFIGFANSVTILGLIVVLAIARTKEGEEESWAVQAGDARKLLYLPLFSVSFLLISWLLASAIEFSLNGSPFMTLSIILNAIFLSVLK